MRLALRLHPDSLSLAATHIDVDVVRPHAGSLVLCYFVTGKIGSLRLPPIAPPARAEELKQFAPAYETSDGRTEAERTRERILADAEFVTRQIPAIDEWVRQHKVTP